MVIVAHPDDAEFGPAAAAARWIAAGSEGWLVCCTSGDQGATTRADPLALAALRETEQRAAAAIVGYAGVTFLHQPDGALANDLALREQLVREIRTFRPDAVLATDPETLFYSDGGINHTDHRAAGIAAVDAVYPAARNPMAFPRLARVGPGRPQGPPALPLLVGPSDAWVDVSATLERKIEALRAHASQIHDPDGLAERIRTWAAEEGARSARPRRRRSGWWSSTTTRTKAPAERSALLEQERPDPAPVVPQLRQAVGAPAEHRHHLGQGEVAGDPARYSSAATSTSRNSSAVSSSFGHWRMRIGSRPA